MSFISSLAKFALLGVTRPAELRAIVYYKVWKDEKELDKDPDSGFDRESMRKCWVFLDKTSRSFSAVIKELDGELCRVVCLFYLVLRGLDTIEDDMTLDLEIKVQLLETFHEKLTTPGWTFTGSGPDERDRQLLVEFDNVITEVSLLDQSYKNVILRICRSMGYGMAHFARIGSKSSVSYPISTLREYDLYCHYVAGLVGEGCSALFSASGKEMPELGKMLSLSNSMGLFLQKNNITRDFREDLNDGRFFWPKEIWGKYSNDPKAFYEESGTEMKEKALWALSEQICDALEHATDCLDYLSLLKNQSIFNFCSIPQVMAITTLELLFMNPDIFHKNVKIRRSLALTLMLQCTNAREVAMVFLHYARRILHKASPADPSFIKICILVGQIEQWAENRYPSWVFEQGKVRAIPQFRDDPNARNIMDARVRQLPLRKEVMQRASGIQNAVRAAGPDPAVAEENKDTEKISKQDWLIFGSIVGGIIVAIFVMMAAIALTIWYLTNDNPENLFKSAKRLEDTVGSVANAASAKIEL